ncbi:hypothetical protein [Couchioplanes caeruleus]|uniref:Uncharacterized protein n=1 Tax=Couchioplanes caeruleus TaxID=56438 RepID=A0A3N1GL47_9ACTN|nr:hypothetical protein [Couchioplanes caeruleus]ROP30950.1 hypothetical protein EDD30_3835 [Couchioplanes caeruleus]
MHLRKLGGLVLLAFAAFYAITNPTEAADFIRTIASGIGSFASELATGDNS